MGARRVCSSCHSDPGSVWVELLLSTGGRGCRSRRVRVCRQCRDALFDDTTFRWASVLMGLDPDEIAAIGEG